MPTAAPTPRAKHFFYLHLVHGLILNKRSVVAKNTEKCMPIFEYICRDCNHSFEALVYGSEKVECPKCHGKKLEPQLSVFAVAAKSPTSPSASPSACSSCGDPRGPGACSLPDLD
jgi:putative FmdB family regulatory protein